MECHRLTAETIEAVLLFRRDELLYDIRNNCFVEGHLLGDEGYFQGHAVQDVGEEGNVDRVTRVLDLAHAECVEALYPYTRREVCTPALQDRLKERDVYGIVLELPADFSQTTLNSLEKLIHEYLATKATEDWLSITNTKKAAVWREKAEELREAIRSRASLRRGRVRRRTSPF